MMLASGIGGVIVLRPRLGGGKPGTDGTFPCDFSDSSRNTPLKSAGAKGAGPLDRNVVWVEVPVERNRSRLDLNQGGAVLRTAVRGRAARAMLLDDSRQGSQRLVRLS